MALHMTGLVSRHNLAHPDEKPAVKPVYETVLKFNPNHGPDGKFSSGGGGRRGGTAGPPTEDAFGSPLSRWGRTKGPGTMGWGAKPHGGYTGKPSTWGKKQTPAAHSQEAQYAGSHVHGRTDGGTMESGALRTRTGGPAGGQFASDKTGVTPHVQEAQYAKSHIHGQSDGGTGRTSTGQFHFENAAGPNFQFSEEQKTRHYKEMFGRNPPTKLKKPKKRSSFS